MAATTYTRAVYRNGTRNPPDVVATNYHLQRDDVDTCVPLDNQVWLTPVWDWNFDNTEEVLTHWIVESGDDWISVHVPYAIGSNAPHVPRPVAERAWLERWLAARGFAATVEDTGGDVKVEFVRQ